MDFIRPPANLTRCPEKEAQRDDARALKVGGVMPAVVMCS